jgi:hypothetical protein
MLLEGFRRPNRRSDVAEARDASHDPRPDLVRRDVLLEDPSVLEPQNVKSLGRGIGPQIARPRAGIVRIFELVDQPRHHEIHSAALELIGGETEHVQVLTVEADDVPAQIDDEDRVVSGVKSRLEERDGFVERKAIGHDCLAIQYATTRNFKPANGLPVVASGLTATAPTTVAEVR